MESPERLSPNAPGRGTGRLGISKWEHDGPVPGCLSWVVAQCQLALHGRKPWVPRHLARLTPPLQSGQKDQDGSWGLQWGTPAFMAPAGLGRGFGAERGPGPGHLGAHPGPFCWLLVSTDGVPHGHGSAQRGQHLVPVCGAHAAGRRPNNDMAHVVPSAVTAALSHRHTER